MDHDRWAAPAEPLDLLDQLHGRSLLAKAADPAKSKWEPKTNKASDAVFVQASPRHRHSVVQKEITCSLPCRVVPHTNDNGCTPEP